ncbi:MAG: topoisomerase DNA-binding C4 zinc finger domain-containing protein, partial [Candidatus Eremiobacteraeota bacterium]|nr:topoisomerase DNA-binding C4 zinc finger domain-containing protein [Candidatus Eremiobacteraeota bacterium]
SATPAKTSKGRIRLPELHESEQLDCRKLDPKQHFTEPPPRFTEATLVKALEDNGVGRPSTYSTIVDTIQARGYVTQHDRRFVPTEIGAAVNDLLVEHFPKIVNLDFTASMEGDLDRVAVGNEDWVTLLRGFYGPFSSELTQAEQKLPRLELRDEPTDEICPNCGRPMVIKTGRFGRFISCSGYPECKTTKPIVKDTGAKCPKDGGAIVERRSRKGRTFYGCANYPECDFISWDRVVPAPCPVCGSYVVAKTRRGGDVRFECAADRAHDVSSIAPAQSSGERSGDESELARTEAP